MSVLCVLVHDDDAEALPTLRLCRRHRDSLRRDLDRLRTLHGELETVLAHGNSPQYGGRVTGTSSEPLPINMGVANLRDQIRHDLAWWVVFVADQRGLTGLPDQRVTAMAAWLLTHVDWISGHAFAAVQCPPVMAGLAGRGRAILAPSGAKRIEIGACHDSVEEGPCGGTLWATCRAEDDPRPSEIYCDGPCGMRKSPEEWRRWGREYMRGRKAS